jgi:hypothetical protein
MFRTVCAVLVGVLLVLGLGATASATSRYPGTDPSITVSDSAVLPGETFTLRAGGFRPGSTVTVTVTLQEGQAAGELGVVATGGSGFGAGFVVVRTATAARTYSAVADSAGFISLPIKLGAAGSYTIVASGTGPNGAAVSVTSSVLVTTDAGTAGSVRAGSSASGGALARTGVDNLATTVWIGFGILVLGGVLVAVASGRGGARKNA